MLFTHKSAPAVSRIAKRSRFLLARQLRRVVLFTVALRVIKVRLEVSENVAARAVQLVIGQKLAITRGHKTWKLHQQSPPILFWEPLMDLYTDEVQRKALHAVLGPSVPHEALSRWRTPDLRHPLLDMTLFRESYPEHRLPRRLSRQVRILLIIIPPKRLHRQFLLKHFLLLHFDIVAMIKFQA